MINTISDAVYLGMKNDVSFLLEDHLNIYEQQSSFNPNMPLRFLEYVTSLFSKYVEERKENKCGSRLIRLPNPNLVVFYNGPDKKEDRETLFLSASYLHQNRRPMVEVEVLMYNINRGRNTDIMTLCPVLYEYSWVIDTYRKLIRERSDKDVFDRVLEEMPGGFLLRDFLRANKAEVKGMLLKEYTEEERKEVFEHSLKREREEGFYDGQRETQIMIVTRMSEQGESIENISRLTGFPIEEIRSVLQNN